VKNHLPFTCHDIQSCAVALLDEQLSPAEVEMVEEHLQHCQPCAELVDSLDEQRLHPPNLQIIQDEAYWEEMDSVLQAELESAERPKESRVTPIQMIFYAAALLCTFIWGWYHRERASHLEKVVYTQQQTLEQLERVSVPITPNLRKNRPTYIPARVDL
jgi:hypothetical protein